MDSLFKVEVKFYNASRGYVLDTITCFELGDTNLPYTRVSILQPGITTPQAAVRAGFKFIHDMRSYLKEDK